MNENENVLQLFDLVKEFGDKKAVDHISLCVRRGEILGMLGPNGAGKTTTIRMILNIIAPDEGRIEILGRSFCEELKNRIGYLPEERGLYRKMKVMDILLFLGELKGMKAAEIKPRALDLLRRFDLDGHHEKKIEELSKGMAQKVQIISTILHRPELVILDEPFSGLDPVNIELVMDLMLQMKAEGISLIFSTHLMEYAEKTCDSVVMINKGRKVLDGRLSEVKAHYGTRFVRLQYEGDAAFVAGLPYVRRVRDYGQEMEIELTEIGEKGRLLREVCDRLTVNGFQLTEPSLQHIFIRNVKEGEIA